MSIQFRCSGCGQAIEVDDQFANRLVACPFCQATIQAPAASQLDAQLPTAAPAGVPGGAPTPFSPPIAPMYGRPSVPVGPNPAWLCTLGMVCALAIPLLWIIFAMAFAQQSGIMPRIQALQSQRQDPVAQQALMLEEVKKWTTAHRATAGFISIGVVVITLIGIAASIAGLIRARSRKWQAVVGLIFCGLCGGCSSLSLLNLFMNGVTGS